MQLLNMLDDGIANKRLVGIVASAPNPQPRRSHEEDDERMRHFGTIVFGSLAAMAALGVLWLAHGAGTGERGAALFGIAMAPVFLLIFVGPFALLFLLFLFRRRRH